MNTTTQHGRLTADPELRVINGANGQTSVVSFSIAVDRRHKKDGQPSADFHKCTAFGKLADHIDKYYRKGSEILITGEVQNNNYEKDGVKHYSYQILVSSAEFCGKKDDNGAPAQTKPATDNNGFLDFPEGEELPFN